MPVGYRAILLLGALLERPGEVLAKSELMDAAWQGMAVEESNLSVQIAALRKLLGPRPRAATGSRRCRASATASRGTVEALGAAADEHAAEPGPSIAVLPFANLSDDAEQQHFADGLAEDIITRLARLRWLFVSARNSSFTYGGKAVDVKQVGRELGVRYVLDGSVRRSGQRLRIGAELSEPTTGLQVWADRYDVDVADFFALQDQIAESVIAAIEPRLYVAEQQRFQRRSPDSARCLGLRHAGDALRLDLVPGRGDRGGGGVTAAGHRHRSRLSPRQQPAGVVAGGTGAARMVDAEAALANARAMAHRAISRDPEDSWAHFAAGYVHMVSRSTEPAVAELNEAIELNPSLAFAHTILGSTYGYGGMADDGLHHCGLATKLSPRAYFHPATLAVTGLCHLMAGRFADAVAFELRAVELRPSFGVAWRTLAAAAGLAGDLDVATQGAFRGAALPPLAVGRVGREISRHRPCEGPRHVHRRTARRGPFVARTLAGHGTAGIALR